jgi:predicted Zn finger-like uncharacterized protein
MSGLEGQSVIVACPRCGARFVIDESGLRGDADAIVLCAACGRGSRIDAAARDAIVAIGEPGLDPVRQEATWPRVVVGHEVPAAARVIAETLRRGGYSPVCVRSGEAVLSAVDPAMPLPASAVVVDVGVPGVLAFEVVEGLRRNPATAGLPIVLLASVYEKTRYKRRPNRLYGADAYLELHHVPDRLVEVLGSALTRRPSGGERQQAPLDRARAQALRTDGVSGEGDGAAIARRLLSDMALYHGDEVARGVREGHPFAFVADAVDAARALHLRVGGAHEVFEVELAAFAVRLVAARQPTDEPRG